MPVGAIRPHADTGTLPASAGIPGVVMETAFASAPGDPTPFWTALSTKLLSFRSGRGRQMELDAVETGAADTLLDNQDRRFDPLNAGVLTNLCQNPSFEVDTTYWSPSGAGVTATRSTAQSFYGAASLLWHTNGGANDAAQYYDGLNIFSPGQIVTYTAWVKPTSTITLDLQMNENSSAPAFLRTTNGTATVCTGGVFTRLSMTVTLGASTANIGFYVTTTGVHAAQDIYVDGVQIELASSATDYIDGSFLEPPGRWAGTANASASYRGGKYYPYVIPMRHTRLRATWASSVYPLIDGDIVDWPQDWSQGGRVNRVAAPILDGFDALADAKFTASLPEQTSGQRITAILDAIGYSPYPRAIDTGQTTVVAKEYADVSALEAIQEVARSEQGLFFMRSDGFATFYERHRQWRAPFTTVQATFSNQPAGGEYPYALAEPTYRRDRIRNAVTVTNDAGQAFTAEDAASISQYRRRSLSVAVITADGNECQALADYLLAFYKDAQLRIETVRIDPQLDPANLFPIVLGYEMGTLVRVKAYPPGSGSGIVDSTCSIQRIEHDVNGEQQRWSTVWQLSPIDTNSYWVLNTGALGTTTKLGF